MPLIVAKAILPFGAQKNAGRDCPIDAEASNETGIEGVVFADERARDQVQVGISHPTGRSSAPLNRAEANPLPSRDPRTLPPIPSKPRWQSAAVLRSQLWPDAG
jgi:hypothetical protein